MTANVRWIDTFLQTPADDLKRQANSQLTKSYIPILFDRHRVSDWTPSQHKFAALPARPFSDLFTKIRKDYYGNPARGLMFLCRGNIITPSQTVGQLYELHKDPHGFLIVTVMEETCFGHHSPKC